MHCKQLCFAGLSSSSSSIEDCRKICPFSAKHYRYKSSSSASVAGFLVPESVKNSVQESVKTSILERVTRDDDKVWKSGYKNSSNMNVGQGCQHNNNHHNNPVNGGLDEQISAWHHDPLDDLYLNFESTQYWPNLPPGVRVDADPFQLSKEDVDRMLADLG